MALISAKRDLAVVVESTWATPPAAYSGYAAVPAEELQFTPAQDALGQPIQTSSFGHKFQSAVGGKGGTITFKTCVPALTTAAADTVLAVIASWFSRLMVGCGWTEALGTGTTISGTASTTTQADVVLATGLVKGSIARILGACRLITASNAVPTPDALTLTPALGSAPAINGTAVYSGASYTLTGPNPTSSYTFSFRIDGVGYVASGCNGTVKLSPANARERLMLEWSFSVNTWTTDVAGTITSGTFPTLTVPTPIQSLGSPFYWGSATARALSSFGFDPGLTLSAQETPSDANGRGAWVYTECAPKATAAAYRSTDATDALQTDYSTPTLRTFVMQLGGTGAAGNNLVIAAEQAQIAGYPAETDQGGKVGIPIPLDVRAPSTAAMPLVTLAIL